eukprot:3935177-Rhodomonas_salina.4
MARCARRRGGGSGAVYLPRGLREDPQLPRAGLFLSSFSLPLHVCPLTTVSSNTSLHTCLFTAAPSARADGGRRAQMAIAEFAEALLVIPKTLAVNAAQVRPPRPAAFSF